jgi:excisionase family DNA binding protein
VCHAAREASPAERDHTVSSRRAPSGLFGVRDGCRRRGGNVPPFRKTDDYLSVKDAAEALNMSVRSCYRLIKAGHLKVSYRPNGGRDGTESGKPRFCVPRNEIERYLGTLAKVRKAS